MKNSTAILVAAIILSACIIFSGVFVGLSISSIRETSRTAEAEQALMRDVEAAEYLGISPESFRAILVQDSVERNSISGGYDTYRFIPFLSIKETKYFTKAELDKWVEYNMHNK